MSRLETVNALGQSGDELGQRPDKASQPHFSFRGPWFSSREAQAYIPCRSLKAFYMWRKRHGIIARANGSVAKADIDRELRKRKPRRVMHPASLANLRKRA